MSNGLTNAYSDKSETWLQKGMATLTKMARPGMPKPAPFVTNPLRDLFSDLIAYVIFFIRTCQASTPNLEEIREKILTLVKSQEERVKSSGVSSATFHEARFAVLSWVDETILNSNWPYRTQWQHLMLTYYGTLNAGEEFFRKLEALPSGANDVREIFYICISLGFEGKYAFGDGHRELKELKQRIYKQWCAVHGDIRQNYARLFPEAYQKPIAAPQAKTKSNRLWYIAAACVPVLLFLCYSYFLWQKSNSVMAMLNTKVVKPIAPEWSSSLVEELRKKGLRAVDEPELVRVTLESLLFGPGRADLNPQALERINDIVATVKRYAPEKSIVVEGHASRESMGDETRNVRLSEQRARTVADVFLRFGFQGSQLSSMGFGSEKPVALNDTEQGRMQNRRVEIIIKK
jgi:type VI secretion system protein ImpK